MKSEKTVTTDVADCFDDIVINEMCKPQHSISIQLYGRHEINKKNNKNRKAPEEKRLEF